MISAALLHLHTSIESSHLPGHRLELLISLRDDFPVVSHLVFHWGRGREDLCVPISVLEAGTREGAPWTMCPGYEDCALPEIPDRDSSGRPLIRLNLDVVDSIIIDLPTRRVTRANDIWLGWEGNELTVRAADTGLGAIVRRLTRGRLRGAPGRGLVDWRYVEFLRGDMDDVADAGARYQMRIGRLPAGTIARIADALPYPHAAELLCLLDEAKAAEVLESTGCDRRVQLFEELTEARGTATLTRMGPDIAADLVSRLDPETIQGALNRIPRERADLIVELLRYPHGTVGSLMTNDLVVLPQDIEVQEALSRLKSSLRGPDFVYFIYIVQDVGSRKLRGFLTLRDLLLADNRRPIREVMDAYLVTLHPMTNAREGAFEVINSGLAALPVVGHEGRLLGALTVDDAVGEVAPPTWRSYAPRIFS